jgi:hypothetical protein
MRPAATPPSPGPGAPSLRRAGWLLTAFGVLTLGATLEHQPSPTTAFASWSRFVTTARFLAGHLLGSIVGQAVYVLAAAALAVAVLPRTRRRTSAVAGFVLAVVGSAGLLAGFGVAAFAQPAIGRFGQVDGPAGRALYDDVYRPVAVTTLVVGAVVFAASTVVLARAVGATPGTRRWAAAALGAVGPLVAVAGLALGPAQTVGALAAIAGGVGLAARPAAGRGPRPAGGRMPGGPET